MSSNNNNTYKRRMGDVCAMIEQQKQQQPEVDTMDTQEPQQPQHRHAKRNGSFHATSSSSRGYLQAGEEHDDQKPPAVERRVGCNATASSTNSNSSSQRQPRHSYRHHSSYTTAPLADRLSSSLASIAFRQQQHQQQRGGSASSSSDTSSNNSHPALVTNDGCGNNTGTTVGSTSSSSNGNAHHHLGGGSTTNSSSNSGSGGDEEIFVTSAKATTSSTHARRNSSNNNNGFASAAVAGTTASSKEQKQQQQSHSLYAHNAYHNESPPRASSTTTTGGMYGLEGDRSAHHHTSVVAASSLSSSGNDKQSGSLSFSQGPAYHIIKQTLMQTTAAATSNDSSSKRKHQLLKKKQQQQQQQGKRGAKSCPRQKKLHSSEDEENYASNTSSSGSGTETGYEGSASSNDILAHRGGGSKSDSKDSTTGSSSSDIPDFSSGASENNAFATSPSNSPSLSSSGDDEDDNDTSSDGLGDRQKRRVQRKPSKNAWHHPKGETSLSLASLQKEPSTAMAPTPMDAVAQFTKITRPKKITSVTTVGAAKSASKKKRAATGLLKQETAAKPPILSLGSDIFVHVLTFLEPPEIQRVLTMPLSRDWLATYCNQQELWRVLCLLEPFKARHVSDEDFSSSSSSSEDENDDDGSLSSFSANVNSEDAWAKRRRQEGGQYRRLRPRKPQQLGKYRLLYTSFTRCMRYLASMREDALHGRPPSVIDYGGSSVLSPRGVASNRNLQQFLAGARDVVDREGAQEDREPQQQEGSQEAAPPLVAAAPTKANRPILSADDGSSSYSSSVEDRRSRKRKKSREQKRSKKPKFGRSMLTDRLLGPTSSGKVNPQNVTLPWSCALYSIVNWMVCFSEVEGIQIMCLKVMPYLLEDEQQRITAQRVGLTDVVLRGMVLFPDNVQLHSASFHTLVLLARPLGGREGMLFHSSMVNSAGIFSGGAASAAVASDNNASGNSDADGNTSGSTGTVFSGARNNGKNGISVMLDSMRRFQSNGELQAMACWSLVNIALAPAQKEVLVKLGGIEATTNAMLHHPHNPEVQFRALFALINLVIPSVNVSEENPTESQQQQRELDDIASGITEELDEMVSQIADLVVSAMKNFCSSEAILNRACLVLHNLSLTQGYHTTLLWTPNCYQMLEWCLANYRTDQVLQQSAAGTLHRLQVTLSNDENLRSRFAASIQAQQQLSLEAAHREALQLCEQQERLRLQQQNARNETP